MLWLPMFLGARFQKPSERLLTKHAASSALRARTRVSGTKMLSRQPSQNLLLKWRLVSIVQRLDSQTK